MIPVAPKRRNGSGFARDAFAAGIVRNISSPMLSESGIGTPGLKAVRRNSQGP